MKATQTFLVLAVALAVTPPATQAWLRGTGPDYMIVKQAEVIAVARLKPDSLKCFPYPPDQQRGAAWEYRGILAISEVLQGDIKTGELPIVIHYGLTPMVGGISDCAGRVYNRREIYKLTHHVDPPSDLIEIFDTGNSSEGFEPLVPDAGQPNLWFLRKYTPRNRPESWPQQLAISEPGDVQPLSLKEYFLAYLAKDPIGAVREQLQKNPSLGSRPLAYLRHIQIEKILSSGNCYDVVERLLPYYVETGCGGRAIEDAFVTCGSVAGPYLFALFNERGHGCLKLNIIHLWGQMRYSGAVDVLVKLLQDDDRKIEYLLTHGLWDGSHPPKPDTLDITGEIQYAIWALAEIGDARAVPVVEQTRTRWEKMTIDPSQLVEWCDHALHRLTGRPLPAPRTASAPANH